MTTDRTKDPADLGRGPFTRWLPVLLQAEPTPPSDGPYPLTSETTPARFLRRVLLSAPRLTIPAAILATLWQICEALVPVIAGTAIDRALATGDTSQLALWLALLAVNFLTLSLSSRVASRLVVRAVELAQHRLRATLSRTVMHPQGTSGNSASAQGPDGTVVSMMTNDVARTAFLGLTVYPVAEVGGIIFIAVSLLWIHWPLGVVVLIGAPGVVWLMGALSGNYSRATRTYQSLLAGTVGQATDLISGYRVIKGIHAEEEATRRYRVASRKTLTGAYDSLTALGRFLAGSDSIAGIFVAGVAALAGWFAISGQLSVGGLIAAVGLAQALLAPMQMVTGNAIPGFAAAYASAGRVVDALKQKLAADGGALHGTPADMTRRSEPLAPSQEPAPSRIPEIGIDAPGAATILIRPGELVGIRSDDRTSAAIARSLLHPQSGTPVQVRLDGVPSQQLLRAEYRAHVIAAPHQVMLFSGTVADNLAVATTDPDRWAEALTAAACDDFITPGDGLGAQVGEMGGRLSGGQRQRLALARALSTDPAVLVLHDPTTAVDSMTESRIANRLAGIRQGRTTILITSSPALLASCDRIIDVQPGKAHEPAPPSYGHSGDQGGQR